MLQASPRKKVGILTLPLTHNYGGILQCVALQKVLEDFGCDVLILDRKYPEPYWKRSLKKIIFWFSFAEIEHFKKKNFSRTSSPIRTSEALKEAVLKNNLEAVIVGSDQVWRAQYVSGFLRDYFLACLSETSIKKIAYAASFGTETLENPLTDGVVSDLLEKFSGISVRETSGLHFLKQHFNIKNASIALDPTLLLPSSFYEEISAEAHTTSLKNTLAVYLLDENYKKLNLIEQLAKEMGLNICQIQHQPKSTLGRIFRQKKSVSQWLQTIKNAEFVVTDSYHGMLFSIIFKKQFVVWINEKRGTTRFISIAQQLGLQHRLLKDVKTIQEASGYREAIDYDSVHAKLVTLQKQSLAFLKNTLY